MEEGNVSPADGSQLYLEVRREHRARLRRARQRRFRKAAVLTLVGTPLCVLALRAGPTVLASAHDRVAQGAAGVSLDGVRASFDGVMDRVALWRSGPVKVRMRVLSPSVAYGHQVGVTGMVSPRDLGRTPLRIEIRQGQERWRLLETVPVSEKGIFSTKVSPSASGLLRARVPKRGVSKEVRIAVRPTATLSPSGQVFWRRPCILRGRVLPAVAGTRLVLQMKESGVWRKVASALTSKGGEYEATVTPRRVGNAVYRVVVPKTTEHVSGFGGPRKIRTWYMVALTFDDGPAVPYTEEIVLTLRRHRARATFFVLGQMVRDNPGVVRRMARYGNVIGNHSWSHRQLTALSEEGVREDLRSTSELVAKITGKRPRWMRPPGGATSGRVNAIARRLGMKVAIWDITTVDWKGGPSYHTIVRRALSQSRPFDMILMHDGGGDRSQTARAVGVMLRQLKARNYLPVTLDEIYPGASAPDPVLPAERTRRSRTF